MVYTALGGLQLALVVELWALRAMVALIGATGLWWFGRVRLKKTMAAGAGCPRCGSTELYRVHRKTTDRIFGAGMKLHRYRCKDPACGWEGLKWSHSAAKRHEKPV
jgi:predicted RNA-binding Zn-ribbon protein involved in translation (DUF1610 family)